MLQEELIAIPQYRYDPVQCRPAISLDDIAQGSCCIFPHREDIVIQEAEPEGIDVLHICSALFRESQSCFCIGRAGCIPDLQSLKMIS